MNRPLPNIKNEINIDDVIDIDPQLVSASLCYLITLYAKGHSENLSSVVLQHLKILIGLSESISPEAAATYRKLKNVWEVSEKQKKMRAAMDCSCKGTIH